MVVLSLRTALEHLSADPHTHELSGQVKNVSELLSEDNLRKLEHSHKGIFAFLAFHPVGDQAITEYLLQGTLSSDSGSTILVLFVIEADARGPRVLSDRDFGSAVEVTEAVHPSYATLQLLFGEVPPPSLPGIAFFDRLGMTEPVYVRLGGLTNVESVRTRLRDVCAMANGCVRSRSRDDPSGFADCFSKALAVKGIPYMRSGRRSLIECLILAARRLFEHRQDLVSVASLVK